MQPNVTTLVEVASLSCALTSAQLDRHDPDFLKSR